MDAFMFSAIVLFYYLGVIIVAPSATLLALRTLFPRLNLDFTFSNWIAVAWILMVLYFI